jgi:tRNA (guanine26-N2/guanine27-N2)-dimethyltransferase
MILAGFEAEEVKEGLAVLLVPKLETYRQSPNEYVPSRAPVFYNPLMKENRDLAVAYLRQIRRESGGGILFGEPLTGTGVRGIRAVLEAGVEHAWINDISKEATAVAAMNVRKNRIEELVTVENRDANIFSIEHSSCFNYLDLDPFGSPSPFLESSIRAVKDGGTIAVTATDMATLCGVYPDKAAARYGGRSIRTVFPKEFAARLLIYAIVAAAARMGCGAKPLLSYASRHYVRTYCRLERGSKKAVKAISEIGHLLYCKWCFFRIGFSIADFKKNAGIGIGCPVCGKRMDMGGPIWLGKHSETSLVQSIIAQTEEGLLDLRTRKMLRVLSLEDTGILGSYPLSKISQYCHRSPPRRQVLLRKLEEAGIEACESALEENAIKTRADIGQISEFL